MLNTRSEILKRFRDKIAAGLPIIGGSPEQESPRSVKRRVRLI